MNTKQAIRLLQELSRSSSFEEIIECEKVEGLETVDRVFYSMEKIFDELKNSIEKRTLRRFGLDRLTWIADTKEHFAFTHDGIFISKKVFANPHYGDYVLVKVRSGDKGEFTTNVKLLDSDKESEFNKALKVIVEEEFNVYIPKLKAAYDKEIQNEIDRKEAEKRYRQERCDMITKKYGIKMLAEKVLRRDNNYGGHEYISIQMQSEVSDDVAKSICKDLGYKVEPSIVNAPICQEEIDIRVYGSEISYKWQGSWDD